jgi:hypothetical protein
MAYQADHAMAHEELKVIDAAWKAKKCKWRTRPRGGCGAA